MIQGGCYHKALETNFRQKIETCLDMLEVEVLDAYSTAWDRKLTEEQEINWEDKQPGALKDEGLRLVRTYQRDRAPYVMPSAVEQEHRGVIDGFPFIGIIDLIKTNGVVVDHKMAARAYNLDDVAKDIQPTSYAFLLGQPIEFEFHVAVKTKEPHVDIMPTVRDDDDIDWWVQMVAAIYAQMKTGIAPPNPNGWHCGPRFCGYWDICRGKGKDKP